MTSPRFQSTGNFEPWFQALTHGAMLRASEAALVRMDNHAVILAAEGAMVRSLLEQRAAQVALQIVRPSVQSQMAHRNSTLMRARSSGVFARNKSFLPDLWRRLAGARGQLSSGQGPVGSQTTVRSQSTISVAIVAALVLSAVALLLASRPTADSPDAMGGVVMRGDEKAQQLLVANPIALADQVEAVLREEGIPSRRAVVGQSVELQAKLSALSSAGRSKLVAMGVVVPPHSRLNLRIDRL
jgi:hypothetical protein